MVIEPTVGRVVWYRPSQFDTRSMAIGNDNQPLDAHIIYVHSNYMVNLVVFDHNGGLFTRTSVFLKQDDPPEDAPTCMEGAPYCEWMPYQIGQAKKHAEDPK